MDITRTKIIIVAALMLFLSVLAAPPLQARKPRNPHWRGKGKTAPVPAAAEAAPEAAASTAPATGEAAPSAAAAAAPPTRALALGRWRPEVRKALEDFMAARGKGSALYDPQSPPTAVLAFNDAMVVNDVGEVVFQRMVEHADFRFSDEFWRDVPLVYGRQRLRAAHDIFAELPVSVWPQQPAYHQYHKGFLKAYRDMCDNLGRLECRTWLVKLLRGYREEELGFYTMTAIGEEHMRPVSEEAVRDSPEDAAPVLIRRGLARIPEMQDLCAALREAGFDVWFMDADAQQELEAVARDYEVDASRVCGVRGKVTADKLSGGIMAPVPIRGGKTDVLMSKLGRAADLVVGAGLDDKELMEHGSGLRLLLDRGDAGMRKLAAEKNWLVQPAFSGKR